MKKHKLNIIPEANQEDYEALKADIGANGYDETLPIILYQGDILDGWNRYKACQELNLEPTYKDFIGTEQEALEYVLRTNKRRNLTSSQWAVIAVEAEDIIKAVREQAIQRERAGVKPSEKVHEGRTDETVAKMFNTNARYFNDAMKLKKEAPELLEKVRSGEATISEVKRTHNREIKQETLKNVELPEGEYDVVYADPPWQYDFSKSPSRDIENQYPTMTAKDMQAMRIPTASNAVLFMWATAPKLPEALDLIKAWDFEYKTNMIWDKQHIGMGYWFRGQHELLIVATKGNYSPPLKPVSSVYSEARTKHSKKPDYFYTLIEEYFPYGKYLELFARKKHSDKWEAWGNEA